MSASSSAAAVEKDSSEADAASPRAPAVGSRLWLRTWLQVLIAELLHLLEPRKSSGVR